MNSFLIKELFYRKLNSPLLSSDTGLSETMADLSMKVGGQGRQLLEQIPDVTSGAISGHYICSTIVNTCFTVGDTKVSDFNPTTQLK